MKTFPNIHTERCVLNRITNNDLPVLQEIFEDVETKRFLPELYALVDKDKGLLSFISAFDSYSDNRNGYLWGVRFDGKLVGFVAIMDMPENPTLFYAMHPAYRSQGLMKECILGIKDFVSDNMNCHFMQSEVYNNNIMSINLLRSADFEIVDANGHKLFLKSKI